MNGERARGAALYASALVLLLAGGLWFFRAAPDTAEDPLVVAGRATVEKLLPDVPLEFSEAETLVLAAGARTDRTTPVDSGSYVLAMLCVGEGQIRVRLSDTGVDSGRAVPCAAAEPREVQIAVGLADQLFMAVSAETNTTTVFRWRVTRTTSY